MDIFCTNSMTRVVSATSDRARIAFPAPWMPENPRDVLRESSDRRDRPPTDPGPLVDPGPMEDPPAAREPPPTPPIAPPGTDAACAAAMRERDATRAVDTAHHSSGSA